MQYSYEMRISEQKKGHEKTVEDLLNQIHDLKTNQNIENDNISEVNAIKKQYEQKVLEVKKLTKEKETLLGQVKSMRSELNSMKSIKNFCSTQSTKNICKSPRRNLFPEISSPGTLVKQYTKCIIFIIPNCPETCNINHFDPVFVSAFKKSESINNVRAEKRALLEDNEEKEYELKNSKAINDDGKNSHSPKPSRKQCLHEEYELGIAHLTLHINII